MGIGGAVLYSLVFMAVRALRHGGALAVRSLSWLGREFLDGAALHGAAVAGVQLFPDPRLGRSQEWVTQRSQHGGATGD